MNRGVAGRPDGHVHTHDDDRHPRTRPRNPLAWPLIFLVRAYQAVVSPWFPPTCRYYPGCSNYAVGSLLKHGPLKGTLLAVWRVLRCNPWSKGGVDLVPERGRWTGGSETGSDDDESAAGTDDDGGARTLDRDVSGARTFAPQEH